VRNFAGGISILGAFKRRVLSSCLVSQ